jgi:hypothetical protein
MNSNEVNWLLQTIEEPENAKRFVQAQYQRGRIPSHVMASLAQDRNWTDWPAVEKPAALTSMECITTRRKILDATALTRTEVMKVRDFATKAKERFGETARRRPTELVVALYIHVMGLLILSLFSGNIVSKVLREAMHGAS